LDSNATDRQIQLELLKSIKRLENKFDTETSSIGNVQRSQLIKIDLNKITIARVKEELDVVQNYQWRNLVILRNINIPSGFVKPGDRGTLAEAIRMLILQEISKLRSTGRQDVSILSIYVLPVGGSNTTFPDFSLNCGSPEDANEIK